MPDIWGRRKVQSIVVNTRSTINEIVATTGGNQSRDVGGASVVGGTIGTVEHDGNN